LIFSGRTVDDVMSVALFIGHLLTDEGQPSSRKTPDQHRQPGPPIRRQV
jgi:hypothetical protein